MKSTVFDKVNIQGVLEVIVRDKQGNVVNSFIDSNMIMTGAKETLAHLIGGDVSGNSVTMFALGNSAAMPTPDDTEIGGIISTELTSGLNNIDSIGVAYLKSLTGHTYPSVGRVAFSWDLDYSEANGLAINEYALLCDDLTMFSRKTREVITKGSDLSVAGLWTIIF